MANLDELMTALENASKNGKTEDAKKLAQIIDQAQRGPTTSDIGAGMADSVLRIGKGIVDLPITLTEAATGIKNPRLLVGNDKKGFQWDDLITAPRFVSADEADAKGFENPFGFTGNEFQNASDALQEAREDINYAPNVSWDEVKKNPSASNIATFIGEGTLTSLPDMAAALVSVPAYFTSYIAPIAQERAENDGREVVTPEDVAIAIGASGVIATAERIGAKGVFGKTTGNAATKTLKAGGKEGVTEGVQNPVEYAASTVGTETGFDPAEALDQAAAGIVQGTGGGAGLKAVTQVPEVVSNKVTKKLDEKDKPVDQEAATELAKDIEAKAADGGFDLSDPDTTSSTGAVRAVDNIHADYTERMRSIENILQDSIKYDKNDTPEVRAKKEKVKVALKKGKNKAKNTVDQEDLKAVEEQLGNTAEGQELIMLLRKSNELTRLHNQGYKGGISRITDTFNPFEGGSQYNAGRIAAAPIINMTTGAAAIGTGGMSVLPQIGAVIGGKLIDKKTGRRSIVERYTKQNRDAEGKTDTRKKRKPSQLLINQAKEAQRVQAIEDKKLAKATEAKRKEALRIEALRRGDPPKGDPNDPNPSPEYLMMQALGTNSRREVADILKEVANDRPDLKDAVESYQRMQTKGTQVLDLNELIAAARNKAGIKTVGPRVAQQATLSAARQDGKKANQEAVDNIKEAVNADKTIDKTDKAKLQAALVKLRSNLGAKPVDRAMEIIAEVEGNLNRPSLAEKYLLPYAQRIAAQQKQ